LDRKGFQALRSTETIKNYGEWDVLRKHENVCEEVNVRAWWTLVGEGRSSIASSKGDAEKKNVSTHSKGKKEKRLIDAVGGSKTLVMVKRQSLSSGMPNTANNQLLVL